MKLICVLLAILCLTLNAQETLNTVQADKRVLCFTFLYFDAGDVFDQYVDNKQSLDQNQRAMIQKRTSVQVERCQEIISDIVTEEQLKAVYSDQQKLMLIILELRRIKSEYESILTFQQLTSSQEQIVKDIEGHQIIFHELRKKKPEMAATQRKAQQGQKQAQL